MENATQVIAPNSLFIITVPLNEGHSRIDLFITKHFPLYSRSYFQRLIGDSLIQVNGKIIEKSSLVVKPTDTIAIQFPPAPEFRPKTSVPHDMGVEIVYTHQDFFVINKPPHLMVHAPSSYSTEITLADWLIAHHPELTGVGTIDRPGIVHRLDKGTSGLMIIARNPISHKLFGDMFRNRTIKKTYVAMVEGHPDTDGVIDFAIARDPHAKTKMTHRCIKGRHATTHYQILEYYKDSSLIELKPITGRTHQLRVHCAAIGHPIIGDIQYNKQSKSIDRQALHAQALSFSYQGQDFSFIQTPPQDFLKVLDFYKNSNSLINS